VPEKEDTQGKKGSAKKENSIVCTSFRKPPAGLEGGPDLSEPVSYPRKGKKTRKTAEISGKRMYHTGSTRSGPWNEKGGRLN